jgi:CRP/FNR family transcriptional regulator
LLLCQNRIVRELAREKIPAKIKELKLQNFERTEKGHTTLTGFSLFGSIWTEHHMPKCLCNALEVKMNHQARIEKLQELYPVLRELPQDLFKQVQESGQYLEAKAGEMLSNIGSPCKAFPMILSGQVRVERSALNGRKIVLFTVEPGDSCIISVSCLLGNSTYPAKVIASADLSGIAIPRDAFMHLFIQSEAFRTFIFRIFSEQIVCLMELIEGLAWEKISTRLAQLLANHPDETFHGTHQMLADELGSVREVVSRALKEFESSDLLKLGRGQIQILDRDELINFTAK